MDFSKRYLLKYGWEEGEGLGKTKSGIKSAIKPKLKFDKAGMGYDPSIEFTDNWWVKLYNDVLEDTHIKQEKGMNQDKSHIEGVETPNTKKRKRNEEPSAIDLFKACKGRTGHKGARHGLQQSGKLQRLEQQEMKLLAKKEDISNNHKKLNYCASSVNNNEGSKVENNVSCKSKKKRRKKISPD